MSLSNLPDKATQGGAPPAPAADLPAVTAEATKAVDQRKDCFVVMPFSDTANHEQEYWTKHFSEFLCPLIDENPELKARRSEALRGDIGRDIITSLVSSPVVVAELTDLNPNVFWELGVRQSFRHCTVTIAEDVTGLPFDIITKGTLFYKPGDYIKMEEFRRQFRRALADCLANPTKPDSAILESMSGRTSLYAIIRRDELVRRIDAVISEMESNAEILKRCTDHAARNLAAKCKEPTGTNERLRICAVEHLVVERYVDRGGDRDKKFYKALGNYLSLQDMLNSSLSTWAADPTGGSKRLLKQKHDLDRLAGKWTEIMTILREWQASRR
jgi:hypothetical protein